MKKKGLLIAIIIILVLLVLAGGTFAYLYFGTDLLKTDKQLFAKYLMQLGDEEKGLFSKALNEYFNKKETTTYQNNGELLSNISVANSNNNTQITNSNSEYFDIMNNSKIQFQGSVDNANLKREENITLSYPDSVSLPFKYKNEGDIYAIQADILSPSYIGIENNNLKELAQKFGTTDVSQIPDKIELNSIDSLNFTQEELKHIRESYIMPIYNNLADEKFTTTENSDGTKTHILTLTYAEALNIYIQTLETLKNDTMILNKIISINAEISGDNNLTVEKLSQTIQEAIDDLQNTNTSSLSTHDIIININQKHGTTNNISVVVDGLTFVFTKSFDNGNLSYNFNILGDENQSVGIQMSYTNLNTDNVQEYVSFSVNNLAGGNFSYTYNNSVTFGTVDIQPFNNNVAILNNYSAEEIQAFLLQCGTIISQTNTRQMAQIGFPETFVNPIVMSYAMPFSYIFIVNSVSDAIDESMDDMAQQQAEVYNLEFTMYEGEISGSQVKRLCDIVQNNNTSNDNKINLKFGEPASLTTMTTNINDIDQIKKSILSGKTYNVTMSYDTATGFVCEVGIVEIQ